MREVRVKKVSAYPIAVQAKSASETIPGQIVKVTLQGFLAELPASSLQAGDRFECVFELPVLRRWVNEPCRVVKLYTQWKPESVNTMMSPTEANSSAAAQGAAGGASPGGSAAGSAGGSSAGRTAIQLVEFHFQGLGAEGRQAIHTFLTHLQKHNL